MVLFCRYEYTKVYEVPLQGNLFVEARHFGLPTTLSRTVTVMNECDAVDLFPAQARAAGLETLDGFSNFYDRRFAERWRYFVADNPAQCTSRYARWSSRVELTLGDLEYSSDRILPWLWINNVEFVRSLAPLDYPQLKKVDERSFVVDGYRKVTRYLYRLQSPLSRVFTLPASVAERTARGDLSVEEHELSELAADGGVSSVAVEAVNGSRLRFAGDFDPSLIVVASVNYHPAWILRIDGQPSSAPLAPGPFGMISFHPVAGIHVYELAFRSRETVFVPVFMLAALGLLWFVGSEPVTARLERLRLFRTRAQTSDPEAVRGHRAFAMWVLSGFLVTILGCGSALLWTVSRHAEVDWFDATWPYRLPLRTQGAHQTAALKDFPLRIERTSADASFWRDVQASGADIRFTDAQGQHLLPFEIEEFDPVRRRMIAWVKVRELTPGPQTIGYLYYGKTNAPAVVGSEPVWDAQYEAVWHMNPRRAARDGVLSDSSPHGHHGRLRGLHPSATDIGRGIPFDGLEAAVEIETWPGLRPATNDWTMEFWIKHAPLKGRNFNILEHLAGGLNLFLHNEGYLVVKGANLDHSVVFVEEPVPQSVWTAVAITGTRRHVRIAVNGVAQSVSPVDPNYRDEATAPLRIGGVGAYGPLEGRLSEIRLSRGVARTADWLLARFRSEAGSFIEIGAAEQRRVR